MKLLQPAFSAGEITPLAHGRTDIQRYGTALKTCRNFIIRPHGCLQNRPGTQYVNTTKYADKRALLVPFEFSDDVTYMLEFGDGYIWVYSNGARIATTTSPKTITNVTFTNNSVQFFSTWIVDTLTPHGYSVGDTVVISGVSGTGKIGKINSALTVTSVPSSTRITIRNQYYPLSGTYSSGGVVYAAADITSPFIEDDLLNLQFAQSADVLTIVSGRLPVYELTRTGATSFSLAAVTYDTGPFMDMNATQTTIYASAATGSVTLTASAGIFTSSHVGALVYLQQIDSSSLQPWEANKVIATGVTSPVSLVRTNDGKTYVCSAAAVATADTATGSIPPTHEEGAQMDGDGSAVTGLASVVGVTWSYVDSGYGIARITAYTDSTHVTATVVQQLPSLVVSSGNATDLWAFGAWSDADGYPKTVTYFGDRIFFANTTAQPQTVWGSKVALYHDFGASTPSVDDDALTFTLNARKINAINDLIALEALIAATSSTIWRVTSGQDEVLTPSTVGFKPQNFTGSYAVRSITLGDGAIYVQNGGRKIAELAYSFQVAKFTGPTLSLLAEHLFPYASTISRLDYAQEPFSLVHCVRDDGVVPTLTYLKDQETVGWSTYDTDGEIEDMCSVTENGSTATYLIVKRTVNGADVRFVERFANREFTDVDDAYFVDCGLSYDGRNTSATTMTLSGGSTWDHDETITLTASSTSGWDTFSSTDIGNEVWLYIDDAEGEEVSVRTRITAYTSDTVVTVVPVSTVPSELRSIATSTWTFAKDVFLGLTHLVGETVNVLADGMDVDPQVVDAAGSIVLQSPAGVVHAGLGFISEIETLDFNIQGAESIRGRTKTVPKVTAMVYNTRGLTFGPDSDTQDEVPEREFEDYDTPISLQTGVQQLAIPCAPNRNGVIVVRQTRPLPVTLIGLIPEVEIGD